MKSTYLATLIFVTSGILNVNASAYSHFPIVDITKLKITDADRTIDNQDAFVTSSAANNYVNILGNQLLCPKTLTGADIDTLRTGSWEHRGTSYNPNNADTFAANAPSEGSSTVVNLKSMGYDTNTNGEIVLTCNYEWRSSTLNSVGRVAGIVGKKIAPYKFSIVSIHKDHKEVNVVNQTQDILTLRWFEHRGGNAIASLELKGEQKITLAMPGRKDVKIKLYEGLRDFGVCLAQLDDSKSAIVIKKVETDENNVRYLCEAN